MGNGVLFLFDGLDEVASEKYARIERSLIKLSEVLRSYGSGNVVVISMRMQFYSSIIGDLSEEYPVALSVKPFSPSDIHRFLSSWPFGQNAVGNVNRIYADLSEKPALREMCANPLVLSMYVAEDQASEGGFFPESRTEFYDRVVNEFLIRRRIKQVGGRSGSASIKEQWEKILGQLAYEHLSNEKEPQNLLNYSHAIRVIEDISDMNPIEARNSFAEISKETGLIAEERIGQTLRFLHLSICEFLAASYCVRHRSNGLEVLLDEYRRLVNLAQAAGARLIEVIPFSGGLEAPYRRPKLVESVYQFDDDRLMLKVFLETKAYTCPEWEGYVKKFYNESLDRGRGVMHEAALSDVFLFVLVLRDADENAKAIKSTALSFDVNKFLEELSQERNLPIKLAISEYARQDAVAALRLSEVLGISFIDEFWETILVNCDQSPMLSVAIEQAVSSSADANKWRQLLAEAALIMPSVAGELDSHHPSGRLMRQVDALKKDHQWHCGGAIRRSFLTDLLSYAIYHKNDATDSRILDVIKEIKRPGSCNIMFFTCRIVSALFSFAVGSATLLFALYLIGAFDDYVFATLIASSGIKEYLLWYGISFALVTYSILIFTIIGAERRKMFRCILGRGRTYEAILAFRFIKILGVVSEFDVYSTPFLRIFDKNSVKAYYKIMARRGWLGDLRQEKEL